MTGVKRLAGLSTLLALAGCSTAGQGIADWPDAQRAITNYYEQNALEESGDCPEVDMLGIGETRVIEDNAREVIVDVRYFWGDENTGRRGEGGDCFGQGQRTFTLTPVTGGAGYDVAAMTGASRSENP